tara:strand:+ start:240 stop:581 length:342 start_codon:yes stop_codon:yes gene_type:complete
MFILFVIIGYISTILTTISYIPQIITIIMHKSGKNISYPYILLITIDVILYIIYGVGFILDNNLDAIPILLGGSMQLVLLFILFSLKIFFGIQKNKNKNNKKENHIEGIGDNI